MRKILILSFLLLGLISRAAVVSLSSVSGHPGEEVDVTVAITNPGAATAAEIDIPLPEGVTFATGSAVTLTDTRHVVAGDVKNGELRLIIHSLTLEPLPSGNIIGFRLKLGKIPGDFILNPKVILSDAGGNRLDCSATPGRVTNIAPYIELSPTTIDFGRQPIRRTYTKSFTIRNTGTETLTVTEIKPSAEEFSIAGTFPLNVAPRGSKTVNFSYSPVARSAGISEKLTLTSDAINGNAALEVKAVPFSVNELHVAERLNGNSDETVTVKLRLNNMEPITGIETDFILPEALVFVPGSLQAVGRASGYNATASVTDNKLKVLAFSPTGTPIEEGNDAVLSFELRLNGRSGSYSLTPSNVILSNPGMENMTSASSGQYVQINSPAISTGSSLSFGNVAVGSQSVANLSVYNAGRAPLNIERVEFNDGIFSIVDELPMEIASYATKQLQIKVAPEKEGKQATTVNIYSNDPESHLKTVTVDVDAYESNQLTLSGEPADDYTAYTLHVALNNYTEITAMQMDIKWIEGMVTSPADMKLTARCPGHASSVAYMGNGVYRIIIFSLTNTPFTGNEGELFSLTYHGQNFTGTTLSAENIILSSASGENYTSPGSSINIIPVEDVRVSAIQLSKTEVELKATQTEQLTATVLPSNAAVKSVSWSSSNPAVAEVSETGMVTAVAVGSATITASADDDSGVRAICNVTVVPTPAEEIRIAAEGDTTLKATETVQLTATVLPETTTDKSVFWKSSVPEVATVTQDGLVTAISVGEAVITATNSAGQSDEITITVVPTPVEYITLNVNKVSLKATDEVQLIAIVSPSTATNKAVNWETSNPEIVTVTQDGMITALIEGEATVTCTSVENPEISASCLVTVIETPSESVSITAQGSTTLKETETVQLTATVLPETTTNKTIGWSTADSAIATVDEQGLVTATGVGEVTVTATTVYGHTATIEITVIPTPVEKIILNQTEVTLKIGTTLELEATVLPETATDKRLRWNTSDETIAIVNSDGLVTALSPGEATITVEAEGGENVSAKCMITVEETPVETIEIIYEGSTELNVGETLQLNVSILPETATDKTVFWQSDNPEVANVDQTGMVTALSTGNALIIVSNAKGIRDELSVTVLDTGGVSDILTDGETFDIFNLEGIALSRGSHTTELEKLPKGTYILKTSSGKTFKIIK